MPSSESDAEQPSLEKARPAPKKKRVLSELQLGVLAAARAKRLENCAAQRREREQATAKPAPPAAGVMKPRGRKPTRRTVVHVPAPADESDSSSSEEEIVYVQAPRRKKAVKKKKKRVVVQAPASSSSEGESTSSSDESDDAAPVAAQPANPYRGMRWV